MNLFAPDKPQCALVSERYGNCPEPVAWAVNINDDEMWLCEKCYRFVERHGRDVIPPLNLLAAIPLDTFTPI